MSEKDEREVLKRAFFDCAEEYASECGLDDIGPKNIYLFLEQLPLTAIVERLQRNLESKCYVIERLTIPKAVRRTQYADRKTLNRLGHDSIEHRAE